MTSANPLLTPSDLAYQLPRFVEITDAHYEEAIRLGIAGQAAEVAEIAADPQPATFDNTLVALERSGSLLRRAQRTFELVHGADANDERDAVMQRVSPLLAAHNDAIYLDAALYGRVRALYEQRDTLGLDGPQAWLLEKYHTRFLRAGAALDDAAAAHLRTLNSELASLYTEFGNKARAEIKALTVDIADVAELDGLSADAIAAAAETARARGTAAPYAIGLMLPTGQPVLATLTNRAVRERIFRASISRGTRGGEHDTTGLIRRIVALRAQRAALLGFPHHAAYQIADNTAGTVEAVSEMLAKLTPPAIANAEAEAAERQEVINAEGGDFILQPWDWAFYTERLRHQRYHIDEAELRPYLELEKVLHDGVFYAATRLYGITFQPRDDLPGYADGVRVFEVFEADGSPLGLFLADFYTRAGKDGGAWMMSLETPNDIAGTRPVVTNNLNIVKPPDGQPTLLTLDEVRTMFHEFGHALHGLFGTARWPRFAGTASPRDFVEYPSQVNEVWMLDPQVLANYAVHYRTGEPLPPEWAHRLRESAAFNEGYATTEYLAASLLDLAWHTLPPTVLIDDVVEFEALALEEAGVEVAAVPPRYRSGYFAHVFSGPEYSAGYYSYIWSEVLDADTVEWFTENGGLSRANGDRYRHELLARCGSADPMTVYREFRGRDPRIEPLLQRRGLLR